MLSIVFEIYMRYGKSRLIWCEVHDLKTIIYIAQINTFPCRQSIECSNVRVRSSRIICRSDTCTIFDNQNAIIFNIIKVCVSTHSCGSIDRIFSSTRNSTFLQSRGVAIKTFIYCLIFRSLPCELFA